MSKRALLDALVKLLLVAGVLNELRGGVMLALLAYGLWQGGAPMLGLVVWGLGGLAISVGLLAIAYRLLRRLAPASALRLARSGPRV